MSFPFTEILDIIGKVMEYVEVQKFLISGFVPGSCLPKLLAGKPMMVNFSGPYFIYSSCSLVYCGVLPHSEATLTTRTFMPLYWLMLTGLPSISMALKS